MTPKSARIAKGSRCLAGAPFCEFDSLTDSVAQTRDASLLLFFSSSLLLFFSSSLLLFFFFLLFFSSSLLLFFSLSLLLITFATLDQCTGSGRT